MGCATQCTPTSDTPVLTAGIQGVLLFYLAEDCLTGCELEGQGPFFCSYQETNGIPDLQRNDAAHDDTCGGHIPSDTLIA